MARSHALTTLARTLRIARLVHDQQLPTREGLALAHELEKEAFEARATSRRKLLLGGAALGASLAVGRSARAGKKKGGPSASVAIVGAGLAGLVCAEELESAGLVPTLYDSASRTGGRQWSLRGHFPGQVAERGGELIDNLHKTMLGYVQAFDLTLEDMNKQPGEVAYYFDGEHVPEEVIVEQFRDFVDSMQDDLRASSGAPTADEHNEADLELDATTLADYLTSRGAGAQLYKAIEQAYIAEYGLAAEEQSSLNFLLFMHADKRSKFTPFGVFSDERYHVVEGNDHIVDGIRGGLAAPVELGHRLVRAAKTSSGRVELTFRTGPGSTVVRVHDYVVFALPFSTLREVELDASLALPAWKRDAIDLLGYGTNAKMMVGFTSRPWRALGSNGSAYADLADVQATWETNPSLGSTSRGVLTDYSSAARGAALDPNKLQQEVSSFLGDLDLVYPGAQAAARKSGGKYVAHLEHWPSSPHQRGSYTCYRPGQFTTLCGNEGKRVGNLLFAGEHANSFYEWQGFMEGACLSGIDAAAELLSLL